MQPWCCLHVLLPPSQPNAPANHYPREFICSTAALAYTLQPKPPTPPSPSLHFPLLAAPAAASISDPTPQPIPPLFTPYIHARLAFHLPHLLLLPLPVFLTNSLRRLPPPLPCPLYALPALAPPPTCCSCQCQYFRSIASHHSGLQLQHGHTCCCAVTSGTTTNRV